MKKLLLLILLSTSALASESTSEDVFGSSDEEFFSSPWPSHPQREGFTIEEEVKWLKAFEEQAQKEETRLKQENHDFPVKRIPDSSLFFEDFDIEGEYRKALEENEVLRQRIGLLIQRPFTMIEKIIWDVEHKSHPQLIQRRYSVG